jgi:hypothetical protein
MKLSRAEAGGQCSNSAAVLFVCAVCVRIRRAAAWGLMVGVALVGRKCKVSSLGAKEITQQQPETGRQADTQAETRRSLFTGPCLLDDLFIYILHWNTIFSVSFLIKHVRAPRKKQ